MQIIKEAILLSGTDGIITVFNLLVGLNIYQFNIYNIFKIVVIAIIGDAISMGISFYNSKENIQEEDRIKGALINILAFILFGSLSLSIFLLLTKKPNIYAAYISIIIPLLILSLFEDSDIKMTLLLGLLGSSITYFISKIVK